MSQLSGYRDVTPAEARRWARGDVVEVWSRERQARFAAVVQRWTEDAVWVLVADPGAVSSLEWPRVALEVWDGDLEPMPAYAPRSRDGVWRAVTPQRAALKETCHD